MQEGRLDEAAPLIEEAYDLATAHYDPADAESLDAMLGLAILYGRADRGSFTESPTSHATSSTKPPAHREANVWTNRSAFCTEAMRNLQQRTLSSPA
ncbi:MAG: hypothetical protein D6788_06795 [Planctomycetota bacterium]|nr:MAG: hypothetical protein D6788_06795 [Planctomycetota bacterium]